VANVANPTELDAGRFFACVRLGSGSVSCWGNGPLAGIGTATAAAKTPVAIPGISDALQLGIGKDHACVLRVTGGISCWGDNSYGQLGDGSGLTSATPVAVADIPDDATSIAVGDVHSCARRAGGGIVCWGQNTLQQLGDDDSGAFQELPVSVIGF
jgi:alpha-tubulin suppressor-like RCC1 family protein